MKWLHELTGPHSMGQIGGATGLIGDPSGRSTERPLSARETIEYNVGQLTEGISQFFKRAMEYAEKRLSPSSTRIAPPNIQNNITWLKDLNLLEFLRTVGFHSRVNTMLARDRWVVSACTRDMLTVIQCFRASCISAGHFRHRIHVPAPASI